jgi:hypothetical protein
MALATTNNRAKAHVSHFVFIRLLKSTAKNNSSVFVFRQTTGYSFFFCWQNLKKKAGY